MDAAALLLQLVAKTFFVALPAGVAWLAFRRLVMSESANAWIYAGVGMFAAFTASGLAPWAFGLQSLNWLFLISAFLCPPLWLATIIICGIGRPVAYDLDEIAEASVETSPEPVRNAAPVEAPLLLEQPIWPEAESVVFRTHRAVVKSSERRMILDTPARDIERSVLEVARAMRGNSSTAKRRQRVLLPPPHAMSDLPNLPFLQR